MHRTADKIRSGFFLTIRLMAVLLAWQEDVDSGDKDKENLEPDRFAERG